MTTAPRTPAALGIWTAAALVVGNMIGSGVFLLPAVLARYGAASLCGWAVTMAGAMLLALVHSWLAAAMPVTGGAYAYARAAFGDRVAFVVAWSYWVCMCCGNAAIAVAFAGSLGTIWSAVLPHGATCALAALWLCTFVNATGVRAAGRVQLLTTALKVVPLLLLGICGLAALGPDAFEPAHPSGEPLLSVTLAAAALTLWAFLGLEAATIPAGAIADPERTVPRATVLGTFVAGAVTMLACTAVIGLAPAAELQEAAQPMAMAASRAWGAWAGAAVGAVAAVSCFGALNGWVLLQAQVPMAAARDGLFPRFFARVDDRGTPRLGLMLSSALATVLVLANYQGSLARLFEFAILLSTAAALVPYAVSVLAWFALARGASPTRRTAAAGALAYSVFALVGTGTQALLWGAALLAVGVVLHGLRRLLRAN